MMAGGVWHAAGVLWAQDARDLENRIEGLLWLAKMNAEDVWRIHELYINLCF
jgi:hypothetical protein